MNDASLEICVTDKLTATLHNPKPVRVPYAIVAVYGGGWVSGHRNRIYDTCSSLAKQLDVPVLAAAYTLSVVDPEIMRKILFTEVASLLLMAFLSHSHVSVALVLSCCVITLLILTYMINCHFCKEDAKHPVQSNDIKANIAYCLAHIADNIVLFGHSAGAHLATLVANDANYENLDRIACVVGMSGVYSNAHFHTITGIIPYILYKSVMSDSAVDDVFPIQKVGPHSPPHFITSAEVDYGLRRHARDMAALLIDNGVFVRWKIYKHTNHFSVRRYFEGVHKHIRDDIVAFIDEIVSTKPWYKTSDLANIDDIAIPSLAYSQ